MQPSPGWRVVDIHVSFLAGFFEFEDRNDPTAAAGAGVMLLGHDDWDCLEDLEAAGFVQVLTLTSGGVKMTDEGNRVASLIRSHKASGGHFAGFRLPVRSAPGPRP